MSDKANPLRITLMDDHDRMAKELHSEMMQLAKKAHAMGFEFTGAHFKKHETENPSVDFGNCTTECGFDENGHYRCWTHCP